MYGILIFSSRVCDNASLHKMHKCILLNIMVYFKFIITANPIHFVQYMYTQNGNIILIKHCVVTKLTAFKSPLLKFLFLTFFIFIIDLDYYLMSGTYYFLTKTCGLLCLSLTLVAYTFLYV